MQKSHVSLPSPPRNGMAIRPARGETNEVRMASRAGSAGWLAAMVESLQAGRDLDSEGMTRLMEQLLAGACSPDEMATLLLALRTKGETAEELASAAAVLRKHCQPLSAGRDVLD